MGIAEEWFTKSERADIARQLLPGAEEKGGKLWAPCPFHSEKSAGGAFNYNPEKDLAFCFSCRASEDLVGLFCAVSGFPQNDADGFRAFKDRFAPGRELRHVEHAPAPAGPASPRVWAAHDEDLPDALWSEKADAFVHKSAERLQALPSVLAQLAAWGIDADTAGKCRLGWNDRDRYAQRTAWGLPYETNAAGKEKKLWLPEGLVLPFYAGGRAARLKIRRPHPERGPEALRDMRYYHVPGGCKRIFVYGRPRCRAWVVVETERDAAMIWGKVRDLGVGAMGTGSASARPDAVAHAILERAEIILVAHDFDQAGAAAWDWRLRIPKNPGEEPRPAWCWCETYPLAVRWPAPGGIKDVGDAVGQGLDVRAWVLAGLPAHVRQRLADARRADARSIAAVAAPAVEPAAPPVEIVETVAGEARPVAVSEPFPDIPGLSFDDPVLADIWNLLPPDYPGKRALFRLLGLFAIYPVRGGRVRNRGEGPERDGVRLVMDEAWRRANPELGREIANLFWGEAHAAWMDWFWPDAPVEWEEKKVRACGAASE